MKEKDFKGAAFDLCRSTERYAIMRSGLFEIETKNCQDTCPNGGKCEEICGERGYCCSSENGYCPRGKSRLDYRVQIIIILIKFKHYQYIQVQFMK